MELWKAAVLGLVEGVTEYLPVSSTGHLILAGWLLGLHGPASADAVDAFDIVVQGGAILAVVALYTDRVRQMAAGLTGGDTAGRRLALHLLVAFVPAAVTGLLFDDLLEALLFHPVPVIVALAGGGVLMLALDWTGITRRGTRTIDEMTWRDALLVGCFQCLALWPGTSRSMSTIAGGSIAGLAPKDAAEFSFLLGLPTLGSATLYALLKNLKHAHDDGRPNLFEVLGVLPVAVGCAVACVSAFVAVRWLVGFLGKHGFAPFGWYRLLLAALVGAAIASGALTLE